MAVGHFSDSLLSYQGVIFEVVPRGGIPLTLQLTDITREFLRDFWHVPAVVPAVLSAL